MSASTGYTGFNTAFGVNGRLWSDVKSAKVSLTWVRGAHSLSTGYEYNDRSVYGRHGSHSPRGSFDFNGQYTGDGFADFLLGPDLRHPAQLSARDVRPRQLALLGRVRAGLLEAALRTSRCGLGLRYEYWHAK